MGPARTDQPRITSLAWSRANLATARGICLKLANRSGTLASAHCFSVAPEYAPCRTITKLPLGGGTPVVLASGLSQTSDIVVDSTTVYWTDNIGCNVMSVPIAGGLPATLATSSEPNAPYAIAVDAMYVYWTHGGQRAEIGKAPLTHAYNPRFGPCLSGCDADRYDAHLLDELRRCEPRCRLGHEASGALKRSLQPGL